MRAFSPEPPLEPKGPEIEKIPGAATGLGAIVHSLDVSLREMGPARTINAWTHVNQVGGFDCPSCAWADPLGHRHSFEFCENGAKAFADDATRKTIGREFFATHSVEQLATQTDHWLNAQGRLAEPLVLDPNEANYKPISWENAFSLIGQELRDCPTPHHAAFYTSGKAVNESAFLFQLLARRFGTNNLPDCSNMCHESSGVGLTESLGAGKSTVTLEDLENADVIVVIGQNPATNHPRMLTSLQIAKRKGARIIAVNPLPELGLFRFRYPQDPLALLGKTQILADHFLQVRINGDLALLQGLAKVLLEMQAIDSIFIDQNTRGFEEFAAQIAQVPWDLIAKESGISEAQIRETADILASSKGTVATWAMGLTQHTNAVDTIQALVNLLLLGGHIGRPGAGLFCVRGHSNVQGDRTMGISESMPEAFYKALEREFHFTCPREPGYNTVETIEAMNEGHLRVFVSLGGNFLSATPDTHAVAQGMRRTRLTVSIATKLNRGHLITGQRALILPCIGRTEQDQIASVENTVSWVSTSQGRFPPASPQLKSEAAIIAGIARATCDVDWSAYANDFELLRERIACIIPGFQNFNERLKEGGFYAPVPPKERKFPTRSGKAEFTRHNIEPLPVEPGQLVMMTVRSHDQFNTVVYDENDRYRGIHHGRRVILMNREDMQERDLEEQQLVDISSHFEGQVRTVQAFRVLPYDIPRGNAATYFPEANPLVPLGQRARKSFTPASKSVIITVTRSS
ncbi:FdhF/YdeP family oxidoreductase [Bryobacter aggregatus]|uniref:FdhF/YdeP family oxidoreductase n=1 Tax=Bryobacter aggregatus TaxID=360054 RepID=UPI0004E0B71F|nr:FdhF/YdeP family oxidoreductase [Bryobacter aggregatus]